MSAKILLVDDEPNILLSLDFLMRKNGYKDFMARNGREALHSIQEQMPDLVILDIMMPDVDGYQICTTIKSSEQFRDIKVIFLSAKSKESDVAKGIEMGADAYIAKPFVNKNLLEKVKELIG